MTKDAVFGLTPLPVSGYAEYVWVSLSENMKTAFRVSATAGRTEHLVMGTPRLLNALARRGLVEPRNLHQLTENGRGLMQWLRSPDGPHDGTWPEGTGGEESS